MWQVNPVNLKPSMQELAGKLVAIWSPEDFRDDQSMGTLGKVFIHCNNILCIGSAIRGTVMYAYRHCRPRSASRSPQYRSLTAPGPTDISGKKKSWHPPSNKSGRMLCMHCYQKQVSRLLDEFNSYFKALSPEVKMRYKDEAKDLV
ncbi:hypothetical protein F5141DRAFT_1065643 [Pisolithus sp. B1]|nr:hypothetical protein F5141DRAFT_1065643 [Pisolithus sp. B1]